MNYRTFFLVWALVLCGFVVWNLFIITPDKERRAYNQGYLDALTWCNETIEGQIANQTDLTGRSITNSDGAIIATGGTVDIQRDCAPVNDGAEDMVL